MQAGGAEAEETKEALSATSVCHGATCPHAVRCQVPAEDNMRDFPAAYKRGKLFVWRQPTDFGFTFSFTRTLRADGWLNRMIVDFAVACPCICTMRCNVTCTCIQRQSRRLVAEKGLDVACLALPKDPIAQPSTIMYSHERAMPTVSVGQLHTSLLHV